MVKQSPQLDDWRGLSELRGAVEQTLARSCRDRNELDDLVQETLLRAACFRRGLIDSSRLRSWVLRIAWNVMRDHVRQERRLRRAEFTEELLTQLESIESVVQEAEVSDDVQVAGSPYDGADVLGLLRGLLTDLSLEDRQLYETYYDEGLACWRVARRMAVTTQTVKMRLYRLRRKLRSGLRKRVMLQLTPCHRELEVVA